MDMFTNTNTFTTLFPYSSVEAVVVGDEMYYVTSGTGEGVFAYSKEEFEAGLAAAQAADEEKYTAFCQAADVEESYVVAREVFAGTELQICRNGVCTRVIDFDEDQSDKESAWWRWHDSDPTRHYESLEEAEDACKSWVDGRSDVGPANLLEYVDVYSGGEGFVLVSVGMPEAAVQVGIGDSLEEAFGSLEGTAIQSAGSGAGELALEWAHGAGWIDCDPDELDEVDDAELYE